VETLVVDRADGIVTVTMDRPSKKNAAKAVMWRELRATFDEVTDRPDDRIMVLTGAGGAFCSGHTLGLGF
jgi:enoyl-CoA hydratase/carnithine racemase